MKELKYDPPPVPFDPIPLMPLPYKPFKGLIHGFYPIAAFLEGLFPNLEIELEECGSRFSAKEYLSGALFTFTFYFFVIGAILGIWVFRSYEVLDTNLRLVVVGFSFAISSAMFTYILFFPKWRSEKLKMELEKNLLFAARHLMIQINAGVPIFDSIVSISEEYSDPYLNYGAISLEFRRIVREVRGGVDLNNALEDSAIRNPSPYYKRAIWQLANANRAGANMGFVLKEIVEFLSNEQRILIRNYGSQLNPLALFYMFTCIIAPTMGVIFLTIMVTISNAELNPVVFSLILLALAFFQMMFIGLIKSRRPMVAL